MNTDTPTCRQHGPMIVAEEGTLNGVLVRWWRCDATTCRTAWQHTEQTDIAQPDLFSDNT